MNKILGLVHLLILCCAVTSCDSFGTKKVKTLVELTPVLTLDSNESGFLDIKSTHTVGIDHRAFKQRGFNLTKNKIISKPTFNKGIIYSADDKGFVSAFSLENKKVLWTHNTTYNQLDPNFSGGGIVFHEDKLYITNGSRYLVVLDAKKGYEIFRKEFADIVRAKPLLINEREVLVLTVSNQAYVYNTANAKTTLLHESLPSVLSSSNKLNPVIYNDKVIIAYNSGVITALDAKKGEALWEIDLAVIREDGSEIDSRISIQPVISQGYIYVATSEKLHKIDLKDGNIIWSKRAQDFVSMSIEENNLLITNNARQVAILDTSSGNIKWIGNLSTGTKSRAKPEVFTAPVLVKNKSGNTELLVAGASGNLFSFVKTHGILSINPIVYPISKNVISMIKGCCTGGLYIIDNHKVFHLD